MADRHDAQDVVELAGFISRHFANAGRQDIALALESEQETLVSAINAFFAENDLAIEFEDEAFREMLDREGNW